MTHIKNTYYFTKAAEGVNIYCEETGNFYLGNGGDGCTSECDDEDTLVEAYGNGVESSDDIINDIMNGEPLTDDDINEESREVRGSSSAYAWVLAQEGGKCTEAYELENVRAVAFCDLSEALNGDDVNEDYVQDVLLVNGNSLIFDSSVEDVEDMSSLEFAEFLENMGDTGYGVPVGEQRDDGIYLPM